MHRDPGRPNSGLRYQFDITCRGAVLPHTNHHVALFFPPSGRRVFPSVRECWLLALSFSISLCVIPGSVASSEADHPLMTRSVVPQASVAPGAIRLPVIDGNDIHFKRISATQGLSQTRVGQIIQDDQGFLWFGTQHGLNRYDGYEFKVFRHEPGNADSLSGVYIYSLLKDRSGTIWVGTDQSLDRFDRTTETFAHYHVDTQDPIVIHISQDSTGMLWLATGKGLYRLESATGKFMQFTHDPNDPLSLGSNDVKSTGEDRSGKFWVANSEGLDAFDRETGKVTLHIPLREAVREFSFHEDRWGVFWIIYGSGGGLAVYDRKTNRLTRYSFYEREAPSTSLTGVYAILEDHDGTVWLGTMGAGLLKFGRAHRRFIRYRSSAGDPESLAENRVIGLFEDREGTIWAGLHAAVPNFFARSLSPFEKLQLSSGNPTNLGETLVNTIYQDRRGTLWMGAGGALNRLDRKTGQLTVYHPAGSGISTEVLTILEDHSGMMWVGTLGNGLARFDRRTGRFKIYRHDSTNPSSISSDIVTRLFIDHTGTLWAATWDGLNRFDPASGRFMVYKRDAQTNTESYNEIAEGQQGALWLGSASGLIRFDPRTAQFTLFKHNPQDPGTIIDDTSNSTYLNSIYVDRSGTVWLGTQNGLDRLDTKTGTFGAYYERDGLSGNAVSCILEEERGDLWMSTNKGLSRFDPQRKTFKNYSAADGLPGDDLTGWGATLRIEILPPWWSTWWFRTIYVALFLFLLLALYFYRLRQIARQFDMRLEERVGERTRIARDLHDTLLQSFQGLMLRFQTVGELLPTRPVDAKEALEGALDRADQALIEGRDAIKDMRASTLVSLDLAQSMNALMTDLNEELATCSKDSVTFRVPVEGTPQTVRPIVRDEIYRIARESLRNAFHHAQARRIETEISYGEPLLRLRFRDDGKGIDPHVLEHGGRAGHWGLPGIRERAKQAGAQLDVWSKLGAGTDVELKIPGSIAYSGIPARSGFRLFRKKAERNYEGRS